MITNSLKTLPQSGGDRATVPASNDPTFAPFPSECAKYGISRTVSYRLLNDGLLDTFKIGSKRYIKLESLRTLPERLQGRKAA